MVNKTVAAKLKRKQVVQYQHAGTLSFIAHAEKQVDFNTRSSIVENTVLVTRNNIKKKS